MIRLIAAGATVAAIAGLGATWYISQSDGGDQFAQCRATVVAGAPEIGGPFELVNKTGQTVTEKEVITEASLIYFGYTFCPDVCPLDVTRNAEAIDVLQERGVSSTPVFISIDPERDTPEVIGDYAENMHEKMIGLTGSLEQVDAASKAYKTYYKRHPGDPDYYLVDHSTFSYLVLPEHGFVEFFRRDQPAEAVANTVQCFVDNA